MVHALPQNVHGQAGLARPALYLQGGVRSLPEPLSVPHTCKIIWTGRILVCEGKEIKNKPIGRNILNSFIYLHKETGTTQTCIESSFIPKESLYSFKLAFMKKINEYLETINKYRSSI